MATLETGKSMNSSSPCCRKSLAAGHEFHGDLSPPFSSRKALPRFPHLASSSHREQKHVCLPSAERTFKLLRNRTTRESSRPGAMAACCTGVYSAGGDMSPEGGDNADGTVACKPSPWKIFLRKLKAETKKIAFSKASARPGFQYDAFSYAMNFDDGVCQHHGRSQSR